MLHFKIFQYLFYYIISRKGFTIMTDIKFQGFSFWRIYFLYVLKVEGGGWRRGRFGVKQESRGSNKRIPERT